MKRLSAVIYKDACLFLRGTGVFVLLLPLVLLLFFRILLWKEPDALRADAHVTPFPLAFRDEDETMMSKTLLRQVEEVELFSEVYVVADETDEELLDRGFVAVTTIPKDFFYEMYDFSDCPATLVLNEAYPLEASLYRAIFTSVMETVRADQSAVAGAYRYRFGTPGEEQKEEMYREISEDLFRDLLGRQQVFDAQAFGADLASSRKEKLLSTLLCALVVLFMGAAARTVPEERRLRVLQRFRGTGGSVFPFAVARFVTALILLLPYVLASVLLLRPEDAAGMLLRTAAGSLAVFLLLTGIGMLSGRVRTVQWAGMGLLFLLLFFGGGIVSLPEDAVRTLRIAVVDEDASASSGELTQELFAQEGITGEVLSSGEAEARLRHGSAEGVLTIASGYEDSLKAQGVTATLHYESSRFAASAQGTRELIAALSAVQRAYHRAVRIVEEETGRTLSAEAQERLKEDMAAAAAQMPALYEVRTISGTPMAEPLEGGWTGLLLFAMLLVMLSAAASFGTAEHARVRSRMRSVYHGGPFLLLKEVRTVLGSGLVTAVVAVLFLRHRLFVSGAGYGLTALIVYGIAMTGLSLLLTALRPMEGRINAFAPLAAILLSLAGGCFLDMTAVSETFGKVSRLFPAGMVRGALLGEPSLLFGLLLYGAIFFAGYLVLTRRR